MDEELLNDFSVTSSSCVFVDYSDKLDQMHSDFIILDSSIKQTNDLLNNVLLGMDIIICILVVSLVSKFILNFFSRGFK